MTVSAAPPVPLAGRFLPSLSAATALRWALAIAIAVIAVFPI